jgi:diguanylate cyclase (GGDEF)-like protein/PAS domain S-box-containing protein
MPPNALLQGSYDLRLVALSVVLAMFASYAALDITGRVMAARGWPRRLWLGSGAAAMGLGIWSMHYIGMLAFSLPVPVLYHYPTVLVSLVAAILASLVALFTVTREKIGAFSYLGGSLVMGMGIATMHYVGMMAMRLPAVMEYRWSLFGLSMALAIAISYVALRLAFRVRQEDKSTRSKFLSAAAMGAGIPLMHYVGMWAVRFYAADQPYDVRWTVQVTRLGVTAIVASTLLVLSLTVATAFLERLFLAEKRVTDAKRNAEAQFQTLAEAIPQIVWTAGPDGKTNYINGRWYEMKGMDRSRGLGSEWSEMVHPDDREICYQEWTECVRSGQTFEIEYRLHDAEKGYRWYLDRAVPLRDDSGVIRQWFGTCTDIEQQKHYQEILEEQIRIRTQQLAEANRKLQEEMRQKDVVRREADLKTEQILLQLTERTRRSTLLAQMGQILQSCITREEVFAAALGFASKIFPQRRGSIIMLNAGGKVAEVIGSWNDCPTPLSVFEPTDCWALRTGHPNLVPKGDVAAPCAHAAGCQNSYLCVPILAQGRTLGIFHIQTTDVYPDYHDWQVSFDMSFAAQLGLSISNIALRDALRFQSIRDPLTGLYNRRYLEEALDREIRRAVRAAHSLGVLMFDLDHFKKFNDTYGHEAGDTVLREIGSFLTRSIRAEDVACRFGGEEFVVLLPTADLNSARMRAERIRADLGELAVLHNGQSLGTITASIGISALPTHGTSTQELLAAADTALYRAKREGRDRVVVAEVRNPEVRPEEARTGVAISITAGK